jgi:lysophospholipase L1-like esterase
VFTAARQLRSQGYTVRVNNLGAPTAVISRTFQALGSQHGQQAFANMIDNLAPFIPQDSTLVTVFTGANDVNVVLAALAGGAGGTDPNGFVDAQVGAFRADYETLIRDVRSRAPNARIVVLNLPNMGALPFMSTASLAARRAAQRAAVGITTTAINPQTAQNIRVVDLMCDARLYQASSFSADGFHPNDAGYAIFAAEIVRAVTLESFPAPRSGCPQMTLVQ